MKRLLIALSLATLGVGIGGCGSGTYRAGYSSGGYHNRYHHTRPYRQTYVRRECYQDRWGDVHCRDVRYRR